MKSILKALRPEEVWQPRVGAPLGNRNALKTGAHTSEARALRKNVAYIRRRMKALTARAEEELRGRMANSEQGVTNGEQ